MIEERKKMTVVVLTVTAALSLIALGWVFVRTGTMGSGSRTEDLMRLDTALRNMEPETPAPEDP